jgi:hypothetical protein
MTGYPSWNAEYEARVKPEADRLYAEVLARRERSAQAGALASSARLR